MNDLEQLREDVRATAPRPRPEFAARLERRVEAGFQAAKPPKERRRLNLAIPAVALAFCALIVVPIALIGGSPGSDDDAGGGAMVQESGENAMGGGGSAAAPDLAPARPGEESLTQSGGADDAVESARRVVERRTALELETGADDFTEVADGVLEVADDSGSIVQSSRVSEQDGKGLARYDLRVPAARLDETLADLSRLGHVTSRTASSQDITRAYVSATARLEDARDERRSLLKALEDADTDAEAESLRRQIRLVRGRIAVAERDVAALRRRSDRAKVSVTVRSTGRRSEGGAWTPGDAVDDAARILEVAAGVLVVTAAVLAPFAILALLAAVAQRTLRRRRREAALDAR